jgi:sterol desaturase/sphingolipid hydroxylase (fatty acid hydroxylase superfamily)
METYATALLYAIPFFLVLVLLEVGYGALVKNQKHRLMDTVSSLSSGLTNIIKDSLGLALILVTYPFLVDQLALFEMGKQWYVWVIAFVALDFAGYWNHRLSHHINIFWNQHVVHHSSEEFNLACALRQSISNVVGYFPLLLLPAALLGVPGEIIAILAPLHLFAQFWYHTQHIGKLGVLEWVIVTPSQHRVHHAINPEYIDKNLGQIFCIWDRIFGTFQEELDDVPPKYGVLKPAQTWNPVVINFQHFGRLAFDAWYARNWTDKARVWFMPTGWRPADVAERFPRTGIQDVYNFEKYSPESSRSLKVFAVLQLLINTAFMLFLFGVFGDLSRNEQLIYGLMVMAGIFGFTSVMDRHRWAWVWELFRSFAGLYLVYQQGDWFGLNEFWPEAWLFIGLYFALNLVWVTYFCFFEFSRDKR